MNSVKQAPSFNIQHTTHNQVTKLPSHQVTMNSVEQAPSVKVVDIFSFVEGVRAFEDNTYHGTYYNLNPKHQRGVIHDNTWKCGIIISLFTFKDIPTVYFHDVTDSESGMKTYESLDGKQRCSAIYEYCTDQFPFTKNKTLIPKEMEGMAGKYYSELTVKQMNYINSFEMVIRYYNFTLSPLQIEAFFRLHQESKATSSGEFLNSGSSRLRNQISDMVRDEDVKHALESFVRNNKRCTQLTAAAIITHMYSCRDDDEYFDLKNEQLYKWWANSGTFSTKDIVCIKSHIIRIAEFMEEVQMGYRFSKGNYCGVSWFLLKEKDAAAGFAKQYEINGFSFPTNFTLGSPHFTMPRYDYMLEMYEDGAGVGLQMLKDADANVDVDVQNCANESIWKKARIEISARFIPRGQQRMRPSRAAKEKCIQRNHNMELYSDNEEEFEVEKMPIMHKK